MDYLLLRFHTYKIAIPLKTVFLFLLTFEVLTANFSEKNTLISSSKSFSFKRIYYTFILIILLFISQVT